MRLIAGSNNLNVGRGVTEAWLVMLLNNVTELRDEIHRFIKAHNEENAKLFKWSKSAVTIIESVQITKLNAIFVGNN